MSSFRAPCFAIPLKRLTNWPIHRCSQARSDLDLSADAEALAHKLAPAAAPELYTRREKRRPPTLMSIAFPAPSRLIVQELADPARYPKTARAQSHLH